MLYLRNVDDALLISVSILGEYVELSIVDNALPTKRGLLSGLWMHKKLNQCIYSELRSGPTIECGYCSLL